MINTRPWLVPAALLVLCAAFTSLGRWQLDRAEVNRRIEQSFLQSDGLPLLDLDLADISVEDQHYRRIRLTGHFEPTVQVLLDNMTRDGRVGYQVLTAFVVDDEGPAAAADPWVLVNRGWVPAAADRSERPDVSILPDAASIQGKIAGLPRAALKLGGPAESADQPLVVLSFPAYDELETVLGHPVHAFQVLLDETASRGFARNWAPATDRDERNIAYAVQWFALAALALALAIGIGINVSRKGRLKS